jgi:hypothetical protein
MKKILLLSTCVLLLTVFLAACNSSYNSPSYTAPDLKSDAGSAKWTPYHGDGYTINYPESWKVESDGSKGYTFSTPDKDASLHVFVTDSPTSTDPLRYEFGSISKDSCKAAGGGLQTKEINGIAWKYSQFVCTPADGGHDVQIGILVSTSLYNNKYYAIDYKADSSNFDTVYQKYFKPMVESYKHQ